jgi:Protein of unknown function (DUF669).
MGFKTNHKEAAQSDFSIKPEGDYEVIIKGIEEKTTRNNKTGLNMKLLIRNDVPGQKFGNGFLFHTFWKRKEPTELDMQVEGYGYGQIMNLSKAANLPDGKDYESLSEYCNDLIDKCIRVTLKHKEYNGKPQERISYINETKFPDCKHVYKESTTANKNGFASKPQEFNTTAQQQTYSPVDISLDDEDLPF